MSQKLLDCIEICTAEHCEYSVIWLHGLGASGHDFEPIIPELQLLQRPGVRFLFPHAPVRPITVNGGAAMRAWYDISSMDIGGREQDLDGIRDSASLINDLISHEIERGIPDKNITLAGFSQGGAIALYEGLTGKHALGGILALSTYLPIQDISLNNLTDSARTVPVFMAHGQQDDVIQLSYAQQSRDAMLANDVQLEWQEYPIAHSISAPQVMDISNWLKRQFGM